MLSLAISSYWILSEFCSACHRLGMRMDRAWKSVQGGAPSGGSLISVANWIISTVDCCCVSRSRSCLKNKLYADKGLRGISLGLFLRPRLAGGGAAEESAPGPRLVLVGLFAAVVPEPWDAASDVSAVLGRFRVASSFDSEGFSSEEPPPPRNLMRSETKSSPVCSVFGLQLGMQSNARDDNNSAVEPSRGCCGLDCSRCGCCVFWVHSLSVSIAPGLSVSQGDRCVGGLVAFTKIRASFVFSAAMAVAVRPWILFMIIYVRYNWSESKK